MGSGDRDVKNSELINAPYKFQALLVNLRIKIEYLDVVYYSRLRLRVKV